MESILETFDWVPARAKCSAEHMFTLLVARIESDVNAMQSCLDQSRYVLTLNKTAADRMIVAKQTVEGGRAYGGRNVMFKRTPSGVAVDTLTVHRETEPRPLFEATIALGPEGRCHYEVSGQPLELWQVSRKALEDLFFS